ncbi:hypothetical protein JCM5350_003947 [Sporobolomyces pararoseus]
MSQHLHQTSRHLARLREDSEPIAHDHVETIESFCDRLNNLARLADISHPSSPLKYILEPILTRLRNLGTSQLVSIREALLHHGLSEAQALLIEDKLKALLKPVRLGHFEEVVSFELPHPVLPPEPDRRGVQADSPNLLHEGIFGREVFRRVRREHVDMEHVKNVSALDLARVVFDFEQDPDNLYAVRIHFERKTILDALNDRGIDLHLPGFIASLREPVPFSTGDPMKRIDQVYRGLSLELPRDFHKITDELRRIQTTLEENIRQNQGWSCLQARRPPWDSDISAAVLVNQVLQKWNNLHGKLTLIGLKESEQAFITIFKETGLKQYQVLPSEAFVAQNRRNLNLNPEATSFVRQGLNPEATDFKP